MSRNHTAPVRKFKGTAVYDWDSEPVEERSSQFASSSLQSIGLSGYSGFEVRRVRRPRRSEGMGTLWVSLLIVATVAGAGLWVLVHWVR